MTTVVSAYYIFPSKFPSQRYFEWIANFLENIPCHLIFFTSEDLIPLLKGMRAKCTKATGKTSFVPLPLENWTAFQRYGRSFWEEQKTLDYEATIHSPELYAIWYEKKEFVRRAIELNPFGHSKFVWCDAGAFRYPVWLPYLQGFAQPDWIPQDKMLLLQVVPFTDAEKQETGNRDFSRVDRIGGGIQAGTIATWKRWSEIYDEQLQIYQDQGRFVGKDQTLLAEIVLRHPDFVHLVPSTDSIGDPWFTLLFFLSYIHPPLISILIPIYNGIEFLPESLQSIEEQEYQNYEVQIGINGWPPGSQTWKTAMDIAQTSKIAKKLHVIDLPEIRGKSEALNEMVKRSRGSWIALLDVDDIWSPKKLEIQSKKMEENDVIGTQGIYFGSVSGQPHIPIGNITFADFWKVNPILNSSVILRKELATWNPKNHILEDYELWLRLRYTPREKPVRFWNCPESLLKHRIHPQSYFNNSNGDSVGDFKKKMQEELISLYSEKTRV
jgi:hypothetical protein